MIRNKVGEYTSYTRLEKCKVLGKVLALLSDLIGGYTRRWTRIKGQIFVPVSQEGILTLLHNPKMLSSLSTQITKSPAA